MKHLVIVAMALAIALPVVAQGQAPVQAVGTKLPTLEEVIFIESGVDRNTVYLGEAVHLTLSFGQLDFRGIRVENYSRTRRLELPDTEGFFAGEVLEEKRNISRDGFTYGLTTYEVPLYPTRAGELFIGAWRWQGTARGYTSDGTRSLSIDQRTEPLSVTVKPLPPAPPEFGGAVGEFSLSATVESNTLTQGVPTTLRVEVAGRGNPQSLRAPGMPNSVWFRLGDPKEATTDDPSKTDRTFVKAFTWELMPLRDGAFDLGPIRLTYFSTETEEYATALASAIPMEVAPSDINEQLVVVGGIGDGGRTGFQIMDDGRLPLATTGEGLVAPWDQASLLFAASLFPVIAFLVVLGVRFLVERASRGERPSSIGVRLQIALEAPDPAVALRGAILLEIEPYIDGNVRGMTARELDSSMSKSGWGEAAGTLSEVLRQCEAMRFAGESPSPAAVQFLAARAGVALEQRVGGGAKQ